MERYVALYDIHAGWEWMHVKGTRVVKPTMDEKAIDIALDFINDFKPTVIIFGGDQINCGPISHWNNDYPGRIGSFTLKDELDYFSDVILSKIKFKHKTRKIWHRGNHERWVSDLLDKYPGLMGLVSIEQYLQLNKRNFEVYDYGEYSGVGKLKFIHGENVPGGINIARNAALRYNTNLRMGHFHTYQVYSMFNPLDVLDIKNVIVSPCLSTRGPQYGNNTPNNHVNGFLYGYINDDGNFSDGAIIIADNKTVVNNKAYSA